MNITISVDKKIVEEARQYARKHSTSLNALIRADLLRYSSSNDHQRRAEEAINYFASIKPVIPAGEKITREEMEER